MYVYMNATTVLGVTLGGMFYVITHVNNIL